MKKQKQRSDHGNGWVKMNRSEIVDEVIAKNKNAWCLLSLIAKRAWRGPGINRHGCRVGEGFIGDYKEYGFTQMGYRVAKKQLEEFGCVSFRTTNRGTIAKLLGPEIFDINVDMSVTDRAKQREDNDQATTNKKLRMEEAKKEKNQKINNTNNAADAGGVGVVLPPAEV